MDRVADAPAPEPDAYRPALEDGRLLVAEGHGHWVMLEDPGRVASLVIPFLRGQLPDPATAPGSPASPPPGP
jgi:pimeloyl-ACP methyl ester carboxylesterase